MEDGYLLGLLIAVLFCGLIVVILVIENKKTIKKIENIKSMVAKEKMELLENTKFYNYESNNNFLVGTSYIYDIVEEETRVEIMLLYKIIPNNKSGIDYDLDSVYMSKDDFREKKLKVGMCVKTLHNTAPQVWLKVKEILNVEK